KEIEYLSGYKEHSVTAFEIGDAVSDGICLVDSDGIVIGINRGYTEITEITEEEMLGKNLKDMLDKGYFSTAVSFQVLEQKKKISALSTIKKNNKKVLITGIPSFDENGDVKQVLTVMRDLTELLKLRDDLEKIEKKSEKYLEELKRLKSEYYKKNSLIGESLQMKEVKETIDYIAKTDATVLISGETGCGKEVVSREIHSRSSRSKMPYIKVNCAAIPDSLIESELFGYEKGAFTGALNKEKLGMFETANGGTILLDEIGEMPLNLQSKLLRVLQEKEITRVGGTRSIKIDVRIIAATNQKLEELIQAGKFREDLYYRLNVVPIKLPPLRERKEDIPLLANSFLEKFNEKYDKEKKFESLAMGAMEAYDWPGNVRELQNVIERLVVIGDEIYITYSHIANILGKSGVKVSLEGSNMTLRQAVDMFERQIIEKALEQHGSTYKAAEALGVTQPTVFRKAKALGIKLGNTKSH
ncbi:MAG: pas modulated sigma54 specific transcriptional regulator, fis family, partial [Firmicutes bacterium]|nr:pas modulated sigma54 specific transcriptional regulator, fis family [Bacillota bacterium]